MTSGGATASIDSRKYWVGFNLVKGIGAARLRLLQDHFGSVEAAWHAPAQALQASGLNPRLVEKFLAVRSGDTVDRVWDRIQALGIQVLTWEDEGYPRRLKEIDQPPPVIYVRGTIIDQDDWSVAVVGTRRITAYGRQVSEQIAGYLAANGVTVVSGLARGVDSAAHKSALESGGRTIAVLGNGVDIVYPPEHRRLAEAIQVQGALISDYAPGTPPESVNFPPRNRIISGLSLAVVIVEAGDRSGALITADFAAEQGRDVFAVPGGINAPQSIGTNRLIQQGAQPLLHPQEILDVLNLNQVNEQIIARKVIPDDPAEASVLSVLSQEPIHIDDLSNQTGIPIEILSATLAMMELKGMVRQVGGMNYIGVHELQSGYEISDGD